MMTPQRGFTRRGDGWWSERSRGSSSDAASVLAGRRRPETGWLWYSLLAPISCSIWRFSDRVLKSTIPAGGGRTLAERQPTLTYASALWAAKPPQSIWPSSLQIGSSWAATSLMCTGSSSHGHWSVAYYPHPTRTVP